MKYIKLSKLDKPMVRQPEEHWKRKDYKWLIDIDGTYFYRSFTLLGTIWKAIRGKRL